MTTKSRRSGGQAAPSTPTADAAAKAADESKTDAAKAAEQTPAEQTPAEQEPAGDGSDGPAPEGTSRAAEQPDGGTAAPADQGDQGDQGDAGSGTPASDGLSIPQQASIATDVLHVDGDPVPEKVDKGMVRAETGVSPAPFAGGTVSTAPTGDDERNGKPLGIGTDTSGELRKADAIPTAATGAGAVNNGAPVNMDGTLTKDFGGNGDPAAKLAGGGVRGEAGVGTLDPDVGPDERPTYPSTTLTRSSARATPREPEDVTRATEPKLGDPDTSTDPIAAAAAIPTLAGDQTLGLLDRQGNEVKPSEFLEVPDEPGAARGFRRVKYRVSELYTVRHAKAPSKRLLFTEGQMVPVAMAETLIALHG